MQVFQIRQNFKSGPIFWNCILAHEVTPSSLIVSIYNGFVFVSQLLDAQNCHELCVVYKLKSCHVIPSQYEKNEG